MTIAQSKAVCEDRANAERASASERKRYMFGRCCSRKTSKSKSRRSSLWGRPRRTRFDARSGNATTSTVATSAAEVSGGSAQVRCDSSSFWQTAQPVCLPSATHSKNFGRYALLLLRLGRATLRVAHLNHCATQGRAAGCSCIPPAAMSLRASTPVAC